MDLQVKNYYFYKYNIYLIRSTIKHRKRNYRMRYPQHRLSFKAIVLKKKKSYSLLCSIQHNLPDFLKL